MDYEVKTREEMVTEELTINFHFHKLSHASLLLISVINWFQSRGKIASNMVGLIFRVGIWTTLEVGDGGGDGEGSN